MSKRPPDHPSHNWLSSSFARPNTSKAIIIALGIFTIITISTFVSQNQMENVFGERKMQTIIHLDLKGAPPRISYFGQFFKLLSDLQVNAVLVEYEDMFPYYGNLSSLPRKDHYTVEEIEELNELAFKNGLELIPLIQSFGHLEFVLKWPQFTQLRENSTANNTICPSDPQSLELIDEMIGQIKSLHPNATTIHIGADEAYHVAEDERCHDKLRTKFNYNVDSLKLNHISNIAKLAKAKNFSRILVWNDMFGSIKASQLKEYDFGNLVEPIVWGYVVDVTKPGYFPDGMFKEYSEVFPSIIFGSAFKGANGLDQTYSEIARYLANLASYHNLERMFSDYLRGHINTVVLTGWQRYFHDGPLCELLPVGIPTMVHQLQYLRDWDSVSPAISKHNVMTVLKCEEYHPEPIRFHAATFYPPPEWNFLKCKFPGHELFESTETLRLIRWKMALSVGDVNIRKELEELKEKITAELNEIYPPSAVAEWIKQNIDPILTPSLPTLQL